jgi:hypothetical protein
MSTPARASRAIIFGFDGLRPDMVSPATTPHLAEFMAGGMRFANSRSVFPSETRVATPSLSTGCRPMSHGLVANSLFDAKASPRVLNTKFPADIAALVAAHGQLLARPSLGARLHAAGRALAVVWTGTSGAALALYPDAQAHGAVRWNPDESSPAAAALAQGFAATPPADIPNSARVAHAAKLFVERVLPLKAAVSLFWSSEPDISFHYRGIGHADSLAALRAADACFGQVVAWRSTQPDAESIAIAAVSDHGQVTGESRVPIADRLRDAGFPVAKESVPGGIVLGGGGAPGLWLSDPAEAAPLVRWLQAAPDIQLVLARAPNGHDGVIPLEALGAKHARSPDLTFTFAGSSAPDRYGLRGQSLIDAADIPAGGGMHGGLHRQEVATVLAFGGAGIPAGVSDTPADLTDIVPSVLALLGIGAEGCDGGALAELSSAAPPPFGVETIAAHAGRSLALWRARGRLYPDAASGS